MLSGCIGRMSFPYPSVRREASVTCGTPNTGRCKQTPYKGENKRMKIDVQTWRSVPKVLGVEKPSPLPLRRDSRQLTLWLNLLAVMLGSHRPAGSNTNRVGSGGQQPRSRCQRRLALVSQKAELAAACKVAGAGWGWGHQEAGGGRLEQEYQTGSRIPAQGEKGWTQCRNRRKRVNPNDAVKGK